MASKKQPSQQTTREPSRRSISHMPLSWSSKFTSLNLHLSETMPSEVQGRATSSNTNTNQNNPFLGILFSIKEAAKILPKISLPFPKISFPFLNPSSPRHTLDLLEFDKEGRSSEIQKYIQKVEAEENKDPSYQGSCPRCLVDFTGSERVRFVTRCTCEQNLQPKQAVYHWLCAPRRRDCPTCGDCLI